MEAVATSKFSELEIPDGAESKIFKDILIIEKWNWEYSDFLSFQKTAQHFISKNKNLAVYIFCNHPHVYTIGRGNERGEEQLVEYDKRSDLPFELFEIHRGGGITFHHPGQWIFYPIKLIKESYTLDDHMCWLLKSVAGALKESYSLSNVLTAKKLMGIWLAKKKIASIGVGLNRFVSEHGLALNIYFDSQAKLGLNAIHPCGLTSETYCSLSDYYDISQESAIKNFHTSFLSELLP